MGSVAGTTLVIAGFLVLISLVQPAAERLRLPYTVLLAFVGGLGSGEFVGEMALLSRRRRQADVVSLGYGRVLELAAADFQRFLSNYPRAKAEIERTAKARTQAGKRLDA